MDNDVVELPEWIKEPVDLALADLLEDGSPGPTLEWRPEGDDAGVLVAGGAFDESNRFEKNEDVPADVMVAVAAWLQEGLFPESTVSRADARPACPGHDHPMRAKNVFDVAWWVCPDGDLPVKVVGEG